MLKWICLKKRDTEKCFLGLTFEIDGDGMEASRDTFFCVFKDLCLMRADEAINFLQTSNVEKFGEKFERAGRKREE